MIRCAYVGLNRCPTHGGGGNGEKYHWTFETEDTGSAWDVQDSVWQEGEPNDWAGHEDCGMICPVHTGTLINDGPCHNSLPCVCEEDNPDDPQVLYLRPDCPTFPWGAWIFLSFLMSFCWCFSAGFCCFGVKKLPKENQGGVCCALFVVMFVTTIVW